MFRWNIADVELIDLVFSFLPQILGVMLSAAYMVAKGTDLLSRAKFCKRSLVKLLQKVVSFKLSVRGFESINNLFIDICCL